MIHKHPYLAGLAGCMLIVLVCLHTYIPHIQQPVGLTHGDAHFVLFILNHYMVTVTNWTNWYDIQGLVSAIANLPMYVGYSPQALRLGEHYLGPAMMALPFYVFTHNSIVAYHAVVLLSFFLSTFCMYLFVYRIVKHFWASLLSAVIFVGNPYMMFRFPDHMLLGMLFWIPLTFLLFERMRESPTRFRSLVFYVFVGLSLLFSFYYSVYLSFLLPLYMVIRLFQTKLDLRRFINIGSTIGGILLLVVVFGTNEFYKSQNGKKVVYANPGYTDQFFSPLISDLFFTSPVNIFYGSLKGSAKKVFPGLVRIDPFDEQNLFVGVIPIALGLLSLVVVRRSVHKTYWFVLVGFALFTLSLSFGPWIHLTPSIALPGPYTIVATLHPIYGQLRIPSRIIVFFYFFLAQIAGLVMAQLRTKYSRKSQVFGMLIIGLLLCEYASVPVDFLSIPDGTVEAYQHLSRRSDLTTLVDIPIANPLPPDALQTRYIDLDARYLLWQTYHGKQILNGYSSIVPEGFYEFTLGLSVNFPTKDKLTMLQKKGIDIVVVHRNEFGDVRDFDRVTRQLDDFKVPRSSFPEGEIYFLKDWKLP